MGTQYIGFYVRFKKIFDIMPNEITEQLFFFLLFISLLKHKNVS